MAEQAQSGSWWTGALVAGFIGGLGDGLATTRHLLLAPDSTRDLALVAVSVVAALVVSVAAGAGIPLAARAMGARWPLSRWTSFLCGAAAWTAVGVAALLPGWWALLALLAFGVIPLVVFREQGRPRMVVALGFVALLAVRVADDRRPRDREIAPPRPGPDIVVVVVDGLRADQLDRLPRGDLPGMPELTALAASGTRFTRVTAPATTSSEAMRAVLTGVSPWTATDEVGWAGALGAQGWRTAIFGGPETRDLAAEVGFMVRDLDPGWPAGLSTGAPGNLWMRLADARGSRRSGRRVVDAWRGWLAAQPPERPALSLLHLSDLRWPTRPTPPWDTAFQRPAAELGDDARSVGACEATAGKEGLRSRAAVRASYDGAAAAVDALVGEVWEQATQRPRGALMIVVGSRGTPMGDTGRWLATGGAVHPSDITVPLVVVGEGAPEGSVLGAPVSTTDVIATVRAMRGLAAVADARPLPALVRGYPPRTVATSVDTEGTVVAVSTEGTWRRTAAGSTDRFVDGQWRADPEGPTVPVPVLQAVASEADPCR